MKKIFLSILLLASVGTSTVYAQKNKKEAVKQANPVSIQTANDSLLYAYGVSLAEQGLEQFLKQADLLVDAETVNSKYSDLIKKAATPSEKARLEKELSFKLDSIEISNKQNIDLFFEGVDESFKTADQNEAYHAGIGIGSQLNKMATLFYENAFDKNEAKPMNKEAILLGMKNAVKGEELLIPESTEMFQRHMQGVKDKDQVEKEKANAEAMAKSKKFIAENATKNGVITLPSGLQYQVITQGTGAKPTTEDRVKVHYHGMLTDGTVFDSSINRGEPITLGVSQVIPGWTEALQLMPVGSKWKLYIPYNLAYGEREAGAIPAYSNLIFEVEILDIEK